MKNRILAILTLALMLLTGCKGTKTVSLQTEYMTNPVGIDVAQPRFSWQMSSSRYGASQSAYQIAVYEGSEEIYNTGKVEDGKSVGIAYAGPALKPCTRYIWEVTVWDELGQTSKASAFFETGLMSPTDRSVWSGAQWIGSKLPHFSRYRSHFNIDFDMQLAEGAEHAIFIFGQKDEDNYYSVDFDISVSPAQLVYGYAKEGEWIEAERIVMPRISPANFYDKHHVKLAIYALDYAKGFNLRASVDGLTLNHNWALAQPYKLDEWKVDSRFHAIGFDQPEGSDVTMSGLTITEDVWNSTLYSNENEFTVKGGESLIWSPADESGAPMLRKEIKIEKDIASARLYTTARGIYEYYINGKRLGNDWFNPGSTDYRYRIMYNTYDITSMLQKGDNGIGAMLGAGWWSDFTGFATSWQDQFGTQLSLLAKIVISYTDGTEDVIVSDPSWKVWDLGPITSDSMQNGEDYNAMREVEGWSNGGFDDSEWYDACVYEAPAEDVELQYYIGSPIQNNITLTAVSVNEPAPGIFVYDMGQNMVGVPCITLKGEKGQQITLRYGEMIYPLEVPEDPMPPLTAEVYAERKGRAYNENYRGALATDHYVCSGAAAGETIQPHFTFHGYRYIEIHGLKEALPLDAVKGVVLESVGEQKSEYRTSDANINRLYQNIVWGQRGNFLSIPTDCPQRDERMGWSGDAQVFARTATYNMNVDQFYYRWIQSVRDIQGEDGSFFDYVPKVGVPPQGSGKGGGSLGWSDVGVILPWQVYQQYADLRFIEEHYDSMKAYMTFLENRSVGDIQPGSGYGDWVAVEHTNSPLTNTAYYGYDAILMAKMAKALGRDEDARYYNDLHERIKVAFNREFVDSEGYTKTSDNVPPFVEWIAGGSDSEHTARTQTSYVVPLQAELFDDVNKPLAVQHLVDDIIAHGNTLTTGFIGTPYITLVLSDNGHDDVAYKLFEQTEYPSWLYPVLQGATTMWERWNSYTIKRGFGMVDMNSFNHYSFGAIQEWMFINSLGIQRDEENPGYRHIILQPKVGGTLKFCRGHYDSIYGRITCGWERITGGYSYTVTVPANTTATLTLQIPEGCRCDVLKGRKEAQEADSSAAGTAVFELPAGYYQFAVRQ